MKAMDLGPWHHGRQPGAFTNRRISEVATVGKTGPSAAHMDDLSNSVLRIPVE